MQNKFVKQLPAIITIGSICLTIALAYIVKDRFFKEEVQQRKVVQQITVITPPPPPPPPPPEEIPEPEVEEEIVEEDLEEPAPDDSMDEIASEDLGLDAEGEAGTDGFGLKAKKGGGSLFGGGYKTVVANSVQECLRKHDRLRYMEYTGKAILKISPDGTIEHLEFIQKSGDESAADYIHAQLTDHCVMKKNRPLEANPVYELALRNLFS